MRFEVFKAPIDSPRTLECGGSAALTALPASTSVLALPYRPNIVPAAAGRHPEECFPRRTIFAASPGKFFSYFFPGNSFAGIG
jgi:hypothetical protein